MTDTTVLSIEPLTATIGARVADVDLGSGSDELFKALDEALHEHAVLFFEDQTLTDDSHRALTSRFGPLYDHALIAGGPSGISILDSSNTMMYGKDLNLGWHTDATFEDRPPYVAVLRAVHLPEVGGDTMWANMHAAYEGLSSKVQRLLDGLEAVHDSSKIALSFQYDPLKRATSAEYKSPGPSSAPEDQTSLEGGENNRQRSALTGPPRTYLHPVVITDPQTGRKAVYVNRNFVTHIVDMSQRESDALLGLLFSLPEQPDCQVRHRWQPGSVAIWHERNTQHFGVGDYRSRRVMHRAIASAEAPRGVS